MSQCRYDHDAKDYLADGELCRRDEYGDPTHHCTARRTCAQHIGQAELTCARCLGRTRTNIRRIRDLAPLMLPVAIGAGVDSQAAMLAGPAADYETFSARRRIDKRWIETHIPERKRVRAMANLLADDDEWHPYSVLGRWDLMIREDYGHPSDVPVTITNAADYLDRQLGRIAQDPGQDWPLFAREIRRCRNHMETVMRNSSAPERGAPCPDCTSEQTGVGPRLVRKYPHWCEDEDCERFHYTTDEADVWVCPRNREHWWSAEGYAEWMKERQAKGKRAGVTA